VDDDDDDDDDADAAANLTRPLTTGAGEGRDDAADAADDAVDAEDAANAVNPITDTANADDADGAVDAEDNNDMDAVEKDSVVAVAHAKTSSCSSSSPPSRLPEPFITAPRLVKTEASSSWPASDAAAAAAAASPPPPPTSPLPTVVVIFLFRDGKACCFVLLVALFRCTGAAGARDTRDDVRGRLAKDEDDDNDGVGFVLCGAT
jgi:hypothetical protein